MKRSLLAVLLAVLAAGGLGLLLWGPGAGAPDTVLDVEPASHDFGRVRHQAVRRTSFRLRNVSQRSLKIMIRANCVCFGVAPNYRRLLEPGDETRVHVQLVSGAVSPQRLRGKALEVRTDHPQAALVSIPLEGDIYLPYELIGQTIDLGQIDGRPKNYEPRRVEIRPVEGYAVVLERTEVTQAGLLEIEAEEPSGSAGTDPIFLTVRLRKDAERPRGRVIAHVRAHLKITDGAGETSREAVLISVSMHFVE